MNKLYIFSIVSIFLAGSVGATRYQPNELTRMYFSSPQKTEVVGEGWLPCPTFSNNNKGWYLDGISTAYYNEIVGQACNNKPIAGPGIEPKP
jgi:hypothetical protein